ncbi:hypothetical protein [Bradyrhizobium liaoningense]
MSRMSLALALWLAASGVCYAQNEVEWKQTINTPKGANMPRDRADILGIELGDTYEDAKVKLLKLYGEGVQPKAAFLSEEQRRRNRFSGTSAPEPMEEEKSVFRLQPPGSATMWTASYVAKLTMKRQMKGVTDRASDETITVFLSAPASGHQVIGVERWINYYTNGDQPRVSEVLAQVNARMKAQPHVYFVSDQGHYTYQFNDGKPVVPSGNGPLLTCRPQHRTTNANEVPQINPAGNCDALFFVQAQFGISRDHARSIQFVLSDNDRAKANLGADFAFVREYVRGLGERTRGAPPKL